MVKKNVFLDDVRSCPDGFMLVRDADACLDMLNHHLIYHLSLDYDLVDKYKNGYYLVEQMVKNHLYADHIIIHSANASGSKKMYNYLKEARNLHLIPGDVKITKRPLPIQ